MLVTSHTRESTLRQALRTLARSVVVITSVHERRRFAMAATAVCELSLDPPSMLLCVNRGASIHRVLNGGAPFAVNVLRKDQRPIADACSGALKGDARFTVGGWTDGAQRVPLLADALASIVCEKVTQLDHGTHSVIVGNVIDVLVSGQRTPLVYADGAYCALAEH